MRLATSPVTAPPSAHRAQSATEPQLRTVRFGDTLFHAAEEGEWDAVAAAARDRGTSLTPLAASVPASRLHVVVQKGRLFQQDHPQVPVLLDRGRYLVVDLGPEEVQKCDHGDRPCYSVRPFTH